jgi:dipeptidyl aminopeptidase/acylaminoacyl peptidase
MKMLVRVAIATLTISATSIPAAEPQPLENFARRPQMQGVSISSDGRYVAFLSGANDDTVIMTFDRSQPGSAFKRVAASEPGKFDIGWCRWANAKRLICGLHGNIRGTKLAELPFKRLFAVNADGTALKTLEEARDQGNMFATTTTPQNFSMHEGGGAVAIDKGIEPQHYADWHMSDNGGFGRSGASSSASFASERQDELFDLTFEDPDTVLIQLDDDKDGLNTVFSLNINSGQRDVRIAESAPVRRFYSDSRGNARVGWGSKEGKAVYYAKLENDAEWRALNSTSAVDPANPLQLIAMASGDTAYAVGAHEGRDALWSLDLTDKRQPQLLFRHPLVDVGEPVLQTDRRLLGVRYDVERPYVWYADEKQRELIDKLERQFEGKWHEIVDSSEDKKTLIIQAFNDSDAGTYYLYDVEKEKLSKLGAAYPELDPRTLGSFSYITYKAKDGTSIPGYLTVPNGVEKKNLPLVVLPHDGPSSRDSWKFSFLRTFLANRGYAVLQMNYRGSSGFGKKWKDGGQGWGGLAYSDIKDGLAWAVSEGIADPKRVCIMGWGFGGYEAMLGAMRDGGSYRCAVSIAGIADLEMYQEHGVMSGERDARAAQMGADRDKLKQLSAVENAASINIPVLLVHGTNDWQVQVDHTNALTKALKKNKKNVESIIIKGASHELERKSDRMTLLKEIEEFLAANLPKS